MNNGIFAGMGSVGEQYPHPAIGETINLINPNDKVVIGGKTFLRYGYLDDIYNYDSSITSNPALTSIVTNTVYTAPTLVANTRQPSAFTFGGNYFIIEWDGLYRRASDLNGTFSSVSGASTTMIDYAIGPTYFYACDNSYNFKFFNANGYYSELGAQTVPYYSLATKPTSGETLATFYLSHNYTDGIGGFTLPGYTWYKNAPLLSDSSAGGYAAGLTWSVCGARWIFVGSTTKIYTSTDLTTGQVGLNWTLRTTPSGITNISSSLAYPTNTGPSGYYIGAFNRTLNANSNTATIFLIRNTNTTTWHVLRTTDGINFTSDTFQNLGLFKDLIVDYTTIPRITYFDNTFYITINLNYSGINTSIIFTSTDDGVSWQPIRIPIIFSNKGTTYPITALEKLGSNYFLLAQTANSHTTVNSLTASHVGIISGNYINQYIRVK